MLTFQDIILLVSALLVPFQPIFPPPLANLIWCWFPIIPSQLTISNNTQQHLLAARAGRKIGMAVYDLQLFGLSVNLISIEIGYHYFCLGYFMPDTIAQVANAPCEMTKKTVRFLFEQAAHIAISCSYKIFNSRASPDWDLSVCLN